jgi:hypothetical protein
MKKITLHDFPVVYRWDDEYGWNPSHIRYEDVERIMGKRLYKQWCKWAMGSTCHIDGPYPWDVMSFLNGEKNWD